MPINQDKCITTGNIAQKAKERGVTLRRLALVVGAVVLVVGVIGLLVPVSVSDGNGGSLEIGRAHV